MSSDRINRFYKSLTHAVGEIAPREFSSVLVDDRMEIFFAGDPLKPAGGTFARKMMAVSTSQEDFLSGYHSELAQKIVDVIFDK